LACQDEFFVDNPLDVNENDELALDCLSPVPPFSFCPEPSMIFKHPHAADACFPERLSNHCQCFRLTFSEICKKFDSRYSDPS
jgi:hypothetical protein